MSGGVYFVMGVFVGAVLVLGFMPLLITFLGGEARPEVPRWCRHCGRRHPCPEHIS